MPQINEIRKAREIGKSGHDKHIWMACADCGKERWVILSNQRRSLRCKHCAAFRANNPQWAGGKVGHSNGYIRIRLYPDDFFYPMAGRDSYVLEHRLVVAQALGRCLLPWETVHHKEGFAKDDNRYPDTLELLPHPSKHNALTRMANYIRKLERELERLKGERGNKA